MAPEFACEVDEAALSDECSTPSQHDNELQLATQPHMIGQHDGKISDKQLFEAIMASSEASRMDDEFESFGRSVAATLRRLKPRLQAAAKVKIQQVLYDLEFGETDADSTASLDLDCS